MTCLLRHAKRILVIEKELLLTAPANMKNYHRRNILETEEDIKILLRAHKKKEKRADK